MSGIDWDNIVIDSSGAHCSCLFDRDSKDIIKNIAKQCEVAMKKGEKEATEADRRLKLQINQLKLELDRKTINDNAVTINNVLNDADNKELSPEEINAKVENAIAASEANDDTTTKEVKRHLEDTEIDEML